ncbi:MAG TPA: arylsulfatase [Opitutaceae bacterium]|nr:arylsulfatase [Opitutaceae bacterium]
MPSSLTDLLRLDHAGASWPLLCAALLPLGATAAHAAAGAPAATERKPNIIWIMADDIGYGDLGCYGQKRIATPNIDRLATQGTRYTQFYAGCAVCAPSRNVLMTGQHTGHTQIRGNAKVDLRPQDITVAQTLKQANYATGLIGKWGLGSEGSDGVPTRKGFDYFFGYIDQTHAHNYYPTFLVRNEQRVPLRNVVPNPGPYGQGVATKKVDYSADLVGADTIKFVEDHKDVPFFLYFSPTLPHANDEERPNGLEIPDYGRYAKEDWPDTEKGYAAMVTLFDQEVGDILAKLKELGLEDNTVIFVTSDNGPHAEGGHDAKFFNSSGPLRGIKRDLYEGGIREPMIIRWPGHVAAGAVSDQVGWFADFLPTAAAIAGVRPPGNLDGISLLPAILGHPAQQQPRDHLYWEFYEGGSSQAVRLGDWKGIRMPMLTGKMQLYDLATDLGEQHDVAAAHSDVVAKIAALMDKDHVPSPLWKVPGHN